MSRGVMILIGLIVGIHSSVGWAFDHSHSAWADFLSKYVVESEHESRVRYSAALKDRLALDRYTTTLSAVTRREYESWSREERLTFLINAYNAWTVQLILDHKVPESIKDIGNLFRSSWRVKFFRLFGEERHLDYIEHELARGQFNECRLHFAFVCASVGCPKLRSVPWLAKDFSTQLDAAARDFLNDTQRNHYDLKTKTLQLSQIFKWYKDDFAKDPKCQSVPEFVARFMSMPLGHQLKSSTPIKYLPYDWRLNRAD